MNRRSFRARPYSTRPGLLSRRGSLATAILALVVVIVITLRFAAPTVLTVIAKPFWKSGAYLTAAAGNAISLTSKNELIKQRDAATNENVSLTAQNAALEARVADLTALLGTRSEAGPGIAAGVLARPPVAPYDVLIVDQGSADGVVEGALVHGIGGTPIGTVASVSSHSARITLYSARGIQTAAWAGATRVPVTLTGASAGAFEATLSKDAGVVAGDAVYVAASGAFPIGTVTKIESDPSSPDVALDIRPYTNPFSLTWVTIDLAR